MTTSLKLRRGTTAQHASFTGAEGEVTVDTTKDTAVVHDGATAGGFPLAKESFLQSETGAVARTIYDKMRESVSVLDFGADATGSADSSIAFQNALNTGKNVFVPRGTYKISGVTMGNSGGSLWGQKIYGVGRSSIIHPTTNNTPCITVLGGSYDNEISDLCFQDNIGGTTADSTAILALNCTRLTLSRLFILEFYYGIHWNETGYAILQNSYIFAPKKVGLQITGGSWHRIVDNEIFAYAETNATATALINISENPSVHITRNYISRGRAPAIRAVATPPPGGYSNNLISIVDNDIDNVYDWAIYITGYWNVHISDNWISAGRVYTDVSDPDTAATGSVFLETCKVIYVKNNDLWQSGSVSSASTYSQQGKGLLIRGCDAGEVSGNLIQYHYYCVYTYNSSNINFHDNMVGEFTGLDAQGTATRYGFYNDTVNKNQNVNFLNNIMQGGSVAQYGGIDTETVLKPRTIATYGSGRDGYFCDNDIYVGNVDATQNSPKNLHFRQKTSSVYGTITGGYSTANNYHGKIVFDGKNNGIDNTAIRFYTSYGPGQIEALQLWPSGDVSPGTDNIRPLGVASNRWSVVYAGTGSINTSDEREKQQIAPIDAAILRAWAKVNYAQFKFNDAVEAKADGARWHFGLIAQQVKAAFESEGLNAFEYGILCYDEWDDAYEAIYAEREVPVLDEAGNATFDHQGRPIFQTEQYDTGETKLVRSAGNRYGIRYEEALALECAFLRSKLPG